MIALAGCTGTVGRRLVPRLLSAKQRVRLLARDADGARRLFGDSIDVAVVDYDRPESLTPAMIGADRLFLLTGRVHVSGGQLLQEANLTSAAKRAGISRVVKLSVMDAAGNSPINYSRWHWLSERLLEESGLAWTVLRPSAFMQNFTELLHGDTFATCADGGRVAMIDAGDIAEAAAVVLSASGHEGATYTLTGPAAISYDEAAEILSRTLQRPVRHKRLPPADLFATLRGAGLPDWLANDLVAQFELFASGAGSQVSRDLLSLIGREGRSFAEFAKTEFFRASSEAPSQ